MVLINAPLGRTSPGLDLVNTLTVVLGVVKVRFQIAPGTGPGLGIANADFRIVSSGTEISRGQTNADGEVEIPLLPLLTGAVTVEIFGSEYNVTLHPGLQPVNTMAGQQKRCDIMGYVTGYQLGTVGNSPPDDGLDGPKTQQAFMNVQHDGDLAIDGTIGNQTRNEMTTKAGE